MQHFCTYFDQNYLARGLTLYKSLTRHANPFVLSALCFDDFTFDVLSRLSLPNLRPISLQAFERDDQALLATKEHRSQVEYYFTCTPSWLLHVLNHFPEVDLVTYLDADLFLYSSPQPIYEELGQRSILIVAHRFAAHLRHMERFGVYNVGLVAARNDPYGRECLEWWRERCLEWCYDRAENGRFADQKYLDDWPERFQQVAVLQHKGAGLAPWNVANYSLTLLDGKIMVDSEPLVFYHFHNFKQMCRWLYDPGLAVFDVRAAPLLKWHVYEPYIAALHDTAKRLSASVGHFEAYTGSTRRQGVAERVPKGTFRTLPREARYRLGAIEKLLQGQLWVVIAGRIL